MLTRIMPYSSNKAIRKKTSGAQSPQNCRQVSFAGKSTVFSYSYRGINPINGILRRFSDNNFAIASTIRTIKDDSGLKESVLKNINENKYNLAALEGLPEHVKLFTHTDKPNEMLAIKSGDKDQTVLRIITQGNYDVPQTSSAELTLMQASEEHNIYAALENLNRDNRK